MRRRAALLLELGSGTVSGCVLILTLAWPTWIERLFEIEPDGGDGSLEALIVGCLVVVTATCGLLARRTWRAAPRV